MSNSMTAKELKLLEFGKPGPGYWRFLLAFLVWMTGLGLVIGSSYQVIETSMLERLEAQATQTALEINQELLQFEGIANAVSDLRTVREVLNGANTKVSTLNRILKKTNETLQTDSIFVLDFDGTVRGSSNYDERGAFLGHNFGFRPYFQLASMGQQSSYYALGVISGQRGYYFSSPIWDGNIVIGVAVVKINLEPMFEKLKAELPEFLIVGFDGVVFAASQPEWNYTSLKVLSDYQRKALTDSRRYGTSSLGTIGPTPQPDMLSQEILALNLSGASHHYLTQNGQVSDGGWHLLVMEPETVFFKRIAQLGLLYSLVFGLFVLVWLYWRQRLDVARHVQHMNVELERRVNDLTSELRASNNELKDLVTHYQNTQTELQDTQDQLVQAAKLAVLGELSAGINHELNQPLLALQTYAENGLKLAERERHDMVKDNLTEILQITGSMHAIVSRFKVFARRSPPEPRPVAVNEIIDGCLVIMMPLVKKNGLDFRVDRSGADAMILCEPIQVQQVLVNLVTNAAEAIESMGETELTQSIRLNVSVSTQEVTIVVEDNGPGIAADIRSKIFEPFYTTKRKGLGIGLALSRRIVETLSGSLSVHEAVEGGTRFTMTLPRWSEE